MNRNQVIVVSTIAVLCLITYIFFDIRKPKEAKTADSGHTTMPQPAKEEMLDIQAYLTEVNSKIEDKDAREKAEQLTTAKNYKQLVALYQQLDKPLAVAYYSMKQAEQESSAASFAQAGDYNMMLLSTAPDAKAKNFLTTNAVHCYEEAVKRDSADVHNRLRLASAYMEGSGSPMQGITILLDVVKKDSTNVEALLMLGRFGIISGQFDKAISRLSKILYLQPQNSEALLLMAEAYNGQGNKAKAIEMLERCKKTVANPDAKREIDKYIENLRKPNS